MTKKRKRKKGKMIAIAFFVFVIYAAYSMISTNGRIAEKQEKIGNLEAGIHEQETENKQLDRLISKGGDKEYIEKYAREKLGYVGPNEVIYYDVAGS